MWAVTGRSGREKSSATPHSGTGDLRMMTTNACGMRAFTVDRSCKLPREQISNGYPINDRAEGIWIQKKSHNCKAVQFSDGTSVDRGFSEMRNGLMANNLERISSGGPPTKRLLIATFRGHIARWKMLVWSGFQTADIGKAPRGPTGKPEPGGMVRDAGFEPATPTVSR